MYSLPGSTKADTLQHINLKVFEEKQCVEAYKKRGAAISTDSQLCVGGEKKKDSCVGDSGSALMISTHTPGQMTISTWKLVGIVSFGPKKCGTENIPGVYTRVRHYVGWIKKVIEQLDWIEYLHYRKYSMEIIRMKENK